MVHKRPRYYASLVAFPRLYDKRRRTYNAWCIRIFWQVDVWWLDYIDGSLFAWIVCMHEYVVLSCYALLLRCSFFSLFSSIFVRFFDMLTRAFGMQIKRSLSQAPSRSPYGSPSLLANFRRMLCGPMPPSFIRRRSILGDEESLIGGDNFTNLPNESAHGMTATNNSSREEAVKQPPPATHPQDPSLHVY